MSNIVQTAETDAKKVLSAVEADAKKDISALEADVKAVETKTYSFKVVAIVAAITFVLGVLTRLL